MDRHTYNASSQIMWQILCISLGHKIMKKKLSLANFFSLFCDQFTFIFFIQFDIELLEWFTVASPSATTRRHCKTIKTNAT